MKIKKRNKTEFSDRLIEIINSVRHVDIEEDTRDRDVVESRFMFFKIMKDFNPKMSFTYIGSFIGKSYDHSSVIHGKNTIEDLMKINSNLRVDYEKILLKLNGQDSKYSEVRLEDLHKEMLEFKNIIQRQSLYIAELNNEFQEVKERTRLLTNANKEYKPVVDLLLERLPKNKIKKALPSLRALLNGL